MKVLHLMGFFLGCFWWFWRFCWIASQRLHLRLHLLQKEKNERS
jgi:hypothetical protein